MKRSGFATLIKKRGATKRRQEREARIAEMKAREICPPPRRRSSALSSQKFR